MCGYLIPNCTGLLPSFRWGLTQKVVPFFMLQFILLDSILLSYRHIFYYFIFIYLWLFFVYYRQRREDNSVYLYLAITDCVLPATQWPDSTNLSGHTPHRKIPTFHYDSRDTVCYNNCSCVEYTQPITHNSCDGTMGEKCISSHPSKTINHETTDEHWGRWCRQN